MKLNRRNEFFLVLAIAVAGGAVYCNTLDGEWVWDDASSVLLHRHVQDPGSVGRLFGEDQHAFGRGAGNFYRPLLSLSFMVDFWLAYAPGRDGVDGAGLPEVSPVLFHLSNMGWHVLAAVLLLALLGRLGAPFGVRAAVVLIWVLHPLHTEAVAYISGRADMMAGAFVFATLFFGLYRGGPGASAWSWLAACGCFCAGLLSKESALIAPVLLLALILLREPSEGEAAPPAYAAFLPLLPLFALLASYLLLRMTWLRFAAPAPVSPTPFLQRVIETGQALAFYFEQIAYPNHLHMEQSLAGVGLGRALLGGGGLALLLGLGWGAWRRGKRRVVMGLGIFLIGWLPISGLIPINAPMAEHWMYLPMAGLIWAVAECLWDGEGIFAGPRVRRVVLACWMLWGFFLGSVTVDRNEDWDNTIRLFTSTLAENPNALRARYNLAVSYESAGDVAAAEREYRWLLTHYAAEAGDADRVALFRQEAEVRFALGRLLFEQGRFEAALGCLELLTRVAPENAVQEAELAEVEALVKACYQHLRGGR